MKKILFCVIVAICLIGSVWFAISLFDIHQQIISNEPESLQSIIENDEVYLKVYTAEDEIDEKESISKIGFEVFDKSNNESIFKSKLICRAYDFKEIKFVNDSNDIIIESEDIGTVYFQRTSYNSWKEVVT